MDIKEYFRAEGFINEFKCFDGRWQFDFNYDDRIYGKDLFQPKLQWTDMFRNEKEKVIFTFNQPDHADAILNVIPLTTNFTIMQCRDKQKEEGEQSDDEIEEEEPTSWYILKLDWLNKKCLLGTETFTCDLLKDINHDSNIWIDQADKYLKEEEDLHFIVYNKKEHDEYINCKYCIINAQRLQCHQNGPSFQLPINLFNCVNFNGHILIGLSNSKDVISHYDLHTRQILASSKSVQGLPPSICIDLEDRPGFDYTSSTAAWASTHLYVWSEEKVENEEEKYFSYIYEIEIETGIAKKLQPKLEGRIRQIFISVDDNLLVHVQKFLREENYVGPPWSKMLYGRKPFFEFKMYYLKFLRNYEQVMDNKCFPNPSQADIRYIQNKV